MHVSIIKTGLSPGSRAMQELVIKRAFVKDFLINKNTNREKKKSKEDSREVIKENNKNKGGKSKNNIFLVGGWKPKLVQGVA